MCKRQQFQWLYVADVKIFRIFANNKNNESMKKTFALITALLTLSVFCVRAQDNQIFTHLSVAPTIGLDGIGVEVATNLTPYVQIHAGYSLFIPPVLGFKGSSFSSIPETIKINENDVRPLREAVSAKTYFNLGGGKLLFDIFPGKNTPFHFTVGLYFCDPKFLAADVDMSKVLRSDEYASYYFELQKDNSASRISSDKNGHFFADVSYNVVRPYLGIGFGRPIRHDKRVSVTFDMGVIYTGNAKLQSYDYTLNENGKPVILTSAMLDNKDKGAVDSVSKIPVMPMLKLNVFIPIF